MHRRNFPDELILNDELLKKKFGVKRRIGAGCFGKIFLALSYKRKQLVAIKVQASKSVNFDPQKYMVIDHEYKFLQKLDGANGVPRAFSFGTCQIGKYMQFQLMDNNLTFYTDQENIVERNLLNEIAIQYIKVLKGIHSKSIIHRDIKPQNMMMKQKQFYLVDFGIAKHFTDCSPTQFKKSFVGTPRYASIRAHEGMQQSPKDDLESLMYVLAHFYHKMLPWMKLPHSKFKLDNILKIKAEKSEALFKKISPGFEQAYKYIRKISPGEMPDYNKLISFLTKSKTVIMKQNPVQRTQQKKLSLPTNRFNIINSHEKPSRRFSVSSNQQILNFSQYNQNSVGTIIINWVNKQEEQNKDYVQQKPKSIDSFQDDQCSMEIDTPIKPLHQLLISDNPFRNEVN